MIIKIMQAGKKIKKKGREGGTKSLLHMKGLPTLLYDFLALTDRIADVLMVEYLITIHKYRLGLCTMALQTLLSLHQFQSWKAFAELGGC